MQSTGFYDLIHKQLNDNLPFVVYRKPGAEKVKALLQNDLEAYGQNSFFSSGFIFAPFDNSREPILIPKKFSKSIHFERSDHTDRLSNLLSEDIPIDNEAKAEYLKMVNKGLEEIRQGRLEKVVLSRKISIPNSKHPLELFKLLELNYPDAMVYCFFHPQIGIWLGATPETLAQIENNVLTTVSLAGTKLFNETIPAAWTEKEKREQQIVTDYILQVLEESSAKTSVSGPETIQAGQVVHLRSVIRAELVGDYSVKSLLEKLHPTPAVCGMPRNEAYKFIMDNETYDREFYTGFLGELNLSEGPEVDLYVNLRCMQLFPEEARVFVGGGITSESIPEHEWLETVDKSKTMVKVIAF